MTAKSWRTTTTLSSCSSCSSHTHTTQHTRTRAQREQRARPVTAVQRDPREARAGRDEAVPGGLLRLHPHGLVDGQGVRGEGRQEGEVVRDPLPGESSRSKSKSWGCCVFFVSLSCRYTCVCIFKDGGFLLCVAVGSHVRISRNVKVGWDLGQTPVNARTAGGRGG